MRAAGLCQPGPGPPCGRPRVGRAVCAQREEIISHQLEPPGKGQAALASGLRPLPLAGERPGPPAVTVPIPTKGELTTAGIFPGGAPCTGHMGCPRGAKDRAVPMVLGNHKFLRIPNLFRSGPAVRSRLF